jgi:hypothetical protein
MFRIFLILAFSVIFASFLVPISGLLPQVLLRRIDIPRVIDSSVYFKESKKGQEREEPERPSGGWRRFIPAIIRNRLEKRQPDQLTETGNRYYLRLINTKKRDKRHTITRIIRFIPDIKWNTAEEIVDAAIEGVSLCSFMSMC